MPETEIEENKLKASLSEVIRICSKKDKDQNEKNKVLIVSAILIDSIEIFKIVMISIANSDPMRWQYELPLFLCSIQLIAIPLAASTNQSPPFIRRISPNAKRKYSEGIKSNIVFLLYMLIIIYILSFFHRVSLEGV